MIPWGFLILAFWGGMTVGFGVAALCRAASEDT